jgi:ankyrin repeat protein
MRVQPQRLQLVLVLSILTLGAVEARGDTSIPLIGATRQGNVEQVRRLLASKADVNARQGDGASALHWASYKGNVEITDLLLRAGANPNLANDLGERRRGRIAEEVEERLRRQIAAKRSRVNGDGRIACARTTVLLSIVKSCELRVKSIDK